MNYKILLTDLYLEMQIGVYDFEHGKTQGVLVSIEADVEIKEDEIVDDIQNVPNYALIKDKIEEIAARGHIKLVEHFASLILDECFTDERIMALHVRVEKTDIFENAKKVGVELYREKG